MRHDDIRRALAERLAALREWHRQLPAPLRRYQWETFHHAKDWLEDRSGTRRAYVEQATGLGKTVEFAAWARFCTGLRVLVVEPTKLLVEQTARAVVKFSGGMVGFLASLPDIRNAAGQVVAARGHRHSDIVVTTDESLGRYAHELATEFQPHLIIFDECHWGYGEPAQGALRHFSEAVIIGFSATPDYLTVLHRPDFVSVTLDNGQQLYAAPGRLAQNNFSLRLDRRTIPWGVTEGWLCPLAWGSLALDVSLEGLPVGEGEAGLDYQGKALAKHLGRHWSQITRAVARLYQSGQYQLASRQVFAACPSQHTARELAEAMNANGIPSACVVSDTSTKRRNRILPAFASGALRLLTSVNVLREGWDVEGAEVCLMLRPFKTYVGYLQTLGRILRPLNGKVALVVDGRFGNTTYQPLSAPDLFLPPGMEVPAGAIILGPGTDVAGVAASPYLDSAGAGERYRVPALAGEYCTGEDGVFEADGETWLTLNSLRRRGIAWDNPRLQVYDGLVRSRRALGNSGQLVTCYALSDILAAQRR
ncbi:MAG: DEAD/DEAH box helicase family protein [Candidatus Magasanikbacteria bacterium]|nr:DEAD/DEAH box helicase family protein [Candidatus Magasanikbacteria bacterium]